MGSGPIRGSGRPRAQQPGLPPWVKSIERTSVQTGSESDHCAPSPESTTVRVPLRTEPSKPPAMAEKDSSAFENASHVFVVFGASVSWLVEAYCSPKWLHFLASGWWMCVCVASSLAVDDLSHDLLFPCPLLWLWCKHWHSFWGRSLFDHEMLAYPLLVEACLCLQNLVNFF